MKITEAKELFECMNFRLSDDDLKVCENAEQTLSMMSSMESFVTHDSEYSVAMESAIESVKKVIQKVKEAFHKLVIRFGVIFRSFQRNIQTNKLIKELVYLGEHGRPSGRMISDDMFALMDVRDAFVKVGIENSWKEEYTGIVDWCITMPEIIRNINDITKRAEEIDKALSNWLKNPDPSVDTKSLREDAKNCTRAINLTIQFLNRYVLNKKNDKKKKNKDDQPEEDE